MFIFSVAITLARRAFMGVRLGVLILDAPFELLAKVVKLSLLFFELFSELLQMGSKLLAGGLLPKIFDKPTLGISGMFLW